MADDYTIDRWTTGIAKRGGGKADAIDIKVNDRAATREAIFAAIRRKGVSVMTRSDWNAKVPAKSLELDWNYTAIALHHAGNSFSCAVNGLSGMRAAEHIEFNSFSQLSYHYAIDCLGTVYEALDIREKGAHIESGNTGFIGVVFLADFSVRGEASAHGPGVGNVLRERGIIGGIKEWIGVERDRVAVAHDEPTKQQIEAVYVLVEQLKNFFHVEMLGGHREFAKTHGTSRSCPGKYGLILAKMLRRDLGLTAP